MNSSRKYFASSAINIIYQLPTKKIIIITIRICDGAYYQNYCILIRMTTRCVFDDSPAAIGGPHIIPYIKR